MGDTTTNNQPPIRSALEADTLKVRALLSKFSLPLDGLEQTRIWVALSGGDVVGCVGLEAYGFQGLLRSLAVEADYQRRGVGAALVRRVMEETRSENIRELYLLTEGAREFFSKKFDFCALTQSEKSAFHGPVSQSKEFSAACPDSAILMKKDLTFPKFA